MQKKYFLSAIAAAFALMLTSCNNDNTGKNVDNEDGVLKITITGYSSDADTRATGTTYENLINDFMVYVFNANTNTLEAQANGIVGGPTTISGLSTGTSKNVVVIANAPTTYPIFDEGDEYDKFIEASAGINLDYQNPNNIQTNGLVMVGQSENPIGLSPTGSTSVTIPLKRLVAKVVLGSITLIPTDAYEADLFEVTGVSIQRAVSESDIFGNTLSTVPEMYCGVVPGSWNSIQKPYLYDALNNPSFTIGIPTNFGNYFYVLPNTDLENCTLLTLSATYDGEEMYFPIRINNAYSSNGNTDGTLVLPNKQYTINLTINHLADGTTDPDLPPAEANLEVNITVESWDTYIEQTEIW